MVNLDSPAVPINFLDSSVSDFLFESEMDKSKLNFNFFVGEHGKQYEPNGNASVLAKNFQTPKSSRKRKRLEHEDNSSNLLEHFIPMVTNASLPLMGKIGCITSIVSILEENKGSPRYLAKEEFLIELGKIMDMMLSEGKPSSQFKDCLKVLEKISATSPEAKTLVQTCCFNPLRKISLQFDVVNKANELLGHLRH